MALSLHASLTIPFQLDSQAAFARIVSTWRDVAPALLPTRADSREPVRHEFDPDDLGEALTFWKGGVWLGRRTSPKLSANVFSMNSVHSNILIRTDAGRRTEGDLERLTLALATVTFPDFGMVHALTSAETIEALAIGRPDIMVINRNTGKASLGAGYSHQLRHGIPTLYWGNLFGPAYIELFGHDFLLAAPAPLVREEPWGIYVRLSDAPPSEETWSAFRATRDRVIEYLGADAFWPNASRTASAMRDFVPPPLPPTAT